MTELLGYLGLFLSAFTSASLLPGSSEIVLGGLWYNGFAPLLLWRACSLMASGERVSNASERAHVVGDNVAKATLIPHTS